MPGVFPIEVEEELANLIGPGASRDGVEMFFEIREEQPASWQVKGLFALALHTEPKVAARALEGFRALPENVIDEAYGQGLEPQIVDLLVREHDSHSKFLSKVLLRDHLSKVALYHLVLNGSDTAIDTIRRRNMNLLNSPVVLELLFENQKVRKSTLDRILQVLGMEVDVSADEENRPPVTPEKDAPEVEIPIDVLDGGADVFNADAFRSFLEGQVFDFASELTDDIYDDPQQLGEEERQSLYHQVMDMAVAEKIKLAMRGNREARNLLLRDSNRLIPLYVLQNKGITIDEVAMLAGNNTTTRELISEICRNREFVKSYKVRRGLATNPKTPLSTALRYVSQLNFKDIKDIARSKNVPTALATAAKNLVKRKQETGALH